MFLTIFTAYQCKVHRVVARKVHPSLLGVGKNYAWAIKFPHAYCAETPGVTERQVDYYSNRTSTKRMPRV